MSPFFSSRQCKQGKHLRRDFWTVHWAEDLIRINSSPTGLARERLNSTQVPSLKPHEVLKISTLVWWGWVQRRRIYTEEKAKVRRCCLGDRINTIPCRSSYFAPGWYKEKDEFMQNSKRGIELNKLCPPNRSNDLCHLFCVNPSCMGEFNHYTNPGLIFKRLKGQCHENCFQTETKGC